MNQLKSCMSLFAVGLMASLSLWGCDQSSDKTVTDETASRDTSGVALDLNADPLIPREHLFDNPQRTIARVSPDGIKVAFLAPLDGVLNAWVGPADDIEAAEPVTNDTGRGIQTISWSPGGTHLIFHQDSNGDENWHVYATELSTKSTRDLTPITGKNISANLTASSWTKPNTIVVRINDRDPRYHDLYTVDLTTGERQLLALNDAGYVAIIVDNDLIPRIAFKANPDGSATAYKADDVGVWTFLTDVKAEDVLAANVVGFSRDNSKLFVVSAAERDTSALIEVDLESGKETLLGASHRADIDGVLVHPTEKTIEAYSINYDREEWVTQSAEIANTLGYLSRVAEGDFTVVNKSQDDSLWMVHYDLTDAPGMYYLVDVKKRVAKPIFNQRPQLSDAPLSKMHPRIIVARDGLELVSYLTLPRLADPDMDGVPSAPVPLVLLVHGGPWARDSFGLDTDHQWLANRGYAVLSVNYRGSTGFGKSFIESATHELAGKMHDDLIDAVNWAVAKEITTPDKVAIMGGSFGGYATLVGLTFTPDQFACGVDLNGTSNLVTLIESFPDYWGPSLDITWYPRVGDPRTEEGRALLLSRSPSEKVDQISKPLIIFQGSNDPRVTELETNQIVQTMQKKDIPVTYVVFDDEGHGITRPENKMAYHALTEAFLSKCLGGRYEPFGDALMGSSADIRIGAEAIPGLSEALAETTP